MSHRRNSKQVWDIDGQKVFNFIRFNCCRRMHINVLKQRFLDFDVIRNITLPISNFKKNYILYFM